MAIEDSPDPVRGGSGKARHPATFDILILDAQSKQCVTSARSLGRAGVRVALGESITQYRPRHEPAVSRSRYCACFMALPDFDSDPAAYMDAVIEFVRKYRVRVVLPAADPGLVLLAAHRERFAELGCTLVVASDAALEIANDKNRTLEIAAKLGIEYPKSVQVAGAEDLRTAEAQFGYPFVLKPTMSWTGGGTERVFPVEVIDETEAMAAAERFLATGCEVLAQQLATGRREGVTLLLGNGEVLGICGAAVHRTTPLLGGVSVMRESIEVPADIRDASVKLAKAIGLEGPAEVEWRRDRDGRPLLMEINARLSGALENSTKSGVDFPLLIWHWATGQPVNPVVSYRTGVRTRWLGGDLRWLYKNVRLRGRPDTVSVPRAIWTFLWEFARTRYYDYFDVRDIGPGLAELRDMFRLPVPSSAIGNPAESNSRRNRQELGVLSRNNLMAFIRSRSNLCLTLK